VGGAGPTAAAGTADAVTTHQQAPTARIAPLDCADRIYEGAPRQNYEEVLRSVGAMLDQRGMREVTLAETDDGFLLQGLAVTPGEDRQWNDPGARLAKETFYLREDDIARFMDEALARRQNRGPKPQGMQLPAGGLLRDGAASG